MGNQSCGVTTSASRDRIGSGSNFGGALPTAPKKKAAAPGAKIAPTEASTTNSLAEDATTLRVFTERISAKFPDLRGASEAMGATGGARLDAVAFEKAMRANLKYTDSSEIERIFKLLDASKLGSISEFELAQLFTGPELLRGLERQLKGKMSTNFVAFNRFRPTGQGDITLKTFQEVLQELLGYKDVALIETLFSIIDIDGRGSISQEEFKNFWNRGYPSPQGFYRPPSNREAEVLKSPKSGTSRSNQGRRQSVTSTTSPDASPKRAGTMKLDTARSDGGTVPCKAPKTANMGRRRSCPSVHMGEN